MWRESPAIPGLWMHSRPINPKDDVMAKAIGAGLREWAANNYRSSDTPPTPSGPNSTPSTDAPDSQQWPIVFDDADKER
jgi:hypothetical protein